MKHDKNTLKKATILLTLVAILILGANFVFAADPIVVNPGGDLQGNITAAPEGSQIIVNSDPGGTIYSGNFVINKTLNISGNGTVTLASNTTDTPVVSFNGTSLGSIFSNFIITNGTGTNGKGIMVNSPTSNTPNVYMLLNNLTVTGNQGTGIHLDETENITIVNCNISYNIRDGIYLWNSSNNTIDRNWITNNQRNGILISGYTDSNDMIIRNNIVNNWGAGIMVGVGGISQGLVNIHFNRIYGQTNPSSYDLYNSCYNGIVNATLNWWGSNENPFTTRHQIYDTYGPTLYDPWLILNLTANPEQILNGESSLIFGSFNNTSDGSPITPELFDYIPDSIQLDYQTNLGSFDTSGLKTVTLYTKFGNVQAALLANEHAGVATIKGILDYYVINSTNAPFTTMNIIPVTNINLTKTANNTRPNVGEPVQFAIVAKNNGPDTATGLVVTDTLPVGLDYLNSSDLGVWNAITRTVTWPAATILNGTNVSYYLTALVNSTRLAGTNVTNVVNETHNEIPGQNTTNCTIYVPLSSVYVITTPTYISTTVGQEVTIHYKVGNHGPDDSQDVMLLLQVPDGLQFVSATVNAGTVTGPDSNGVLTWMVGNIAANTDPEGEFYFRALRPSTFVLNSTILSATYNAGGSVFVSPVTILAVNAAQAETGTVGMQSTGAPIVPLAIAVLSILGGLAITRKKQ